MKIIKIARRDDLVQLKAFDQEKNVFICFGNNLEFIDDLQKSVVYSKIVGCSTSGAIFKSLIISPNEGIVIGVIELKKTESKIFVEDFDGYDDSYSCGERIGKKITEGKNLAGTIVFMEGLLMNPSSFTVGLNKENTKKIPIMGGLASDELTFTKTFVFDNKKIYDKSAIAVAFYGEDFRIKAFSTAGIESFGIERRVTKSIKNILYEIDGKPALDVYESFLGAQLYQPGKELNFPIEISENFKTKEGLIRTPLVINKERRTITFTSEIPENSTIRFMLAAKNDLILAAEEVERQIDKFVNENGIEKFGSLIISCAARSVVMGEESSMELPTKARNNFGFYSYGEFFKQNTTCDLANYTYTQGIIYEI